MAATDILAIYFLLSKALTETIFVCVGKVLESYFPAAFTALISILKLKVIWYNTLFCSIMPLPFTLAEKLQTPSWFVGNEAQIYKAHCCAKSHHIRMCHTLNVQVCSLTHHSFKSLLCDNYFMIVVSLTAAEYSFCTPRYMFCCGNFSNRSLRLCHPKLN